MSLCFSESNDMIMTFDDDFFIRLEYFYTVFSKNNIPFLSCPCEAFIHVVEGVQSGIVAPFRRMGNLGRLLADDMKCPEVQKNTATTAVLISFGYGLFIRRKIADDGGLMLRKSRSFGDLRVFSCSAERCGF